MAGMTCRPPPPGTASGSGLGMVPITRQLAGVSTVKENAALRSGWSKTAKTRRASSTSNWE